MKSEILLARGIEAAKGGNKATARNLFYDVVDLDPKNEAAWVWLSYVVETIEDRKVCLENVLVINSTSEYALHGLDEIEELLNPSPKPADDNPANRNSLPLLNFTLAFWMGLGLISLGIGLLETGRWFTSLLKSRTFLYYITPDQLWNLTIPVLFLVLGIIILNVVWALYIRHKMGLFTSIFLALAFTVIGPTAILISSASAYLLAGLAAILPIAIFFFSLIILVDREYERKTPAYVNRD